MLDTSGWVTMDHCTIHSTLCIEAALSLELGRKDNRQPKILKKTKSSRGIPKHTALSWKRNPK